MTNNKDLYIEYLRAQGIPEKGKDFDKYYVIEIIRRGKDNPNLPASNLHFKNFYIDSIEAFETKWSMIKEICDHFNMRAYFSINYKLCSQVLLDTISESARRASTHDYKKPWAIYESCSGKFLDNKDKKWIIDIDNCHPGDLIIKQYIDILKKCPPFVDYINIIPTKSGVHLISKPFNRIEFSKLTAIHRLPMPDIKENHLSLLYENIKTL